VLTARVLQGLQSSTAAQLDQIPQEVAVDRIQLIRRGYVLAGVLGVAALYLVLSPKSPMVSFGRVLWPWAKIAAPSRVQIADIQPGDAVLYQGRSVTVSAAVEGLREGEELLLRYSTDDGQIVDQAIPLAAGEGFGRWSCQLPPGKAGLQQPLTYYLTAGDCRTEVFDLEMEVPPTIVVDAVRYRYPSYTGLPERLVMDTADLRAIDGTQVLLEATANRAIQWAAIEVNGQVNSRRRMRAEGRVAKGELALALDDDPAREPRWYQIRFAESESGDNRENVEPVRHQIEVFADRGPTVRLIDPPADRATVPLDGMVELTLEAADPDFALRRAGIGGECQSRRLPIAALLDRPAPRQGHEGKFKATYRLRPAELGLQVGDEVLYWAEAEDNREPKRNRAETDSRWLKVGPPQRMDEDGHQTGESGQPGQPEGGETGGESEGEGSEGEAAMAEPTEGGEASEGEAGESGAGAEGEEGEEGEAGGEPSDSSAQEGGGGEEGESGQPQENSEQGEGEGEGAEGDGGGEPSGPREEPVNGETNAGDVFDEVMKQMDKEQQGQPGQEGEGESGQSPSEPSPPGEGEGGGEAEAGEETEGAADHEGESGVEPNRTEGEGEEGGDAADQAPEGAEGAGGEATSNPADPSAGSSPKSESDAGGGTPTGRPGDGDPSGDQEAVEGESMKPEDVQGGQPDSAQRQPGDGQPKHEAEGDQAPQTGSPTAGEPSGTGRKPDGEPTPMPEGANQPNAEKPSGGMQDETTESEAPSASQSKEQTESADHEPTEGDQSGGGGKGGGQDSDQPGLGNPGSTTAADEGGQPGGEQGEGETGPGAGDKTPTDQATGNTAEQPGGSTGGPASPEGGKPGEGEQASRDDPGGGEPTEMPAAPAEGQPGSDPARRGTLGDETGQSGGNREGAAEPGTAAGQPNAGGTDPIKEYADEATDLALEYLQDQLQKSEPNQELLDRLGWNRGDLEQFVRRWQQMKADATQSGAAGDEARSELDDALRSLGLRPQGTGLESGGIESDALRSTEAIRTKVPAAWREQMREYSRSIGAGGSEE